MLNCLSVSSRLQIALLFTFSPLFTCSATCTQADLTGTWYLNAFVVSSVDSLGYWTKCKLSVNSAGAISRAGSSCLYDVGATRKVSGSLRINRACAISAATFSLWDPFDVLAGTTKLNFGTLDRGKTVMTGVGDASTVEPWVFTGVKP